MHTKRLPDYPRETRCAELAAYASLGAAAILTVALAISNMLEFPGGSDQISDALSARQAVVVRNAKDNEEKSSPTNLTTTGALPLREPMAAPDQV